MGVRGAVRGVALLLGTNPDSAAAVAETGFDVEQVGSVEAAIERLERGRVDCVVSGHDPPAVDGLALAERLRKRRTGVPLVLMPTDGSEALASEAIAVGVSEYVPVADSPERLVTAVERAVERDRDRLDYHEVFENADVGLCIYDTADGSLLDVNGRHCELLGYTREELLELGLEDVVADLPGYDCESGHELLERAVEETSFTFEWPGRRKGGDVVWVEVDGTVIATGGDERLLLTTRDVSGRRERERALETLHTAAARMGACESVEAVCEATVGAASDVLDFGMCSVLVAEDGWLVPKGVSAGAPAGGARRMRTDQGFAGRTFQTGESALVEDVREAADADPADERYRSGISVPVGDVAVFQAAAEEPGAFDEADVELVELLVAHTARALDRIRFEAELRDQQTELRRQNERLEEFASVVSHDLRNPLNVAHAGVELAREDGENADFDIVVDALERMNAIIDGTLTLARQGRSEIDPVTLDLESFANQCWGLVETDGAELKVEKSFSFRADPDRLHSLFENLFRNSVEHSSTSNRTKPDDAVEHGSTNDRPKHDDALRYGATSGQQSSITGSEESVTGDPSVTVRVGAIDRDGFYVEDDGPGIPAEERGRVFEVGYTTVGGGTGFGLAIVEEVVDAHDWDVSVTEAPSGGARFEVTGVEGCD